MPRDDEIRALVRRHGAVIDRYLRSVEANAETREEHWSDVFTVAFRRLDDLAGLDDGQVRGWLLATARNVNRNAVRRAATRKQLVERLAREPVAPAPSAEELFFGSIRDLEHVRAAWATLTSSHQQVLMLSIEGADGPTIARQLGITRQAARSRLMRARAAFAEAYERNGAAR